MSAGFIGRGGVVGRRNRGIDGVGPVRGAAQRVVEKLWKEFGWRWRGGEEGSDHGEGWAKAILGVREVRGFTRQSFPGWFAIGEMLAWVIRTYWKEAAEYFEGGEMEWSSVVSSGVRPEAVGLRRVPGMKVGWESFGA